MYALRLGLAGTRYKIIVYRFARFAFAFVEDDYLSVRISESSREEMKLLPLNDSVKVVCVVRTYLGPVADSKVSFYDTGWNELPADRFVVLPQEDRFYKQPLAETAADSLNSLWQRRRQIRCATCVCMPICI